MFQVSEFPKLENLKHSMFQLFGFRNHQLNREESRSLKHSMFQVSEFLKLENLKHCMFQLFGLSAASLKDKTQCFVPSNCSPKFRLLQKPEFHDFTMFCLFPPETEITILGFSVRRARRTFAALFDNGRKYDPKIGRNFPCTPP